MCPVPRLASAFAHRIDVGTVRKGCARRGEGLASWEAAIGSRSGPLCQSVNFPRLKSKTWQAMEKRGSWILSPQT
jgi:hypothetical protein